MVKKDNLIGFRTPTERDKERVKREAESLCMSMYELVEAGLRAERKPNTKQDLEYKKRSLVYERDRLISDVQDLNKRIEAYNRQLRDKYPNDYKDLPDSNGTLYIYDKDGNLLFWFLNFTFFVLTPLLTVNIYVNIYIKQLILIL